MNLILNKYYSFTGMHQYNIICVCEKYAPAAKSKREYCKTLMHPFPKISERIDL